MSAWYVAAPSKICVNGQRSNKDCFERVAPWVSKPAWLTLTCYRRHPVCTQAPLVVVFQAVACARQVGWWQGVSKLDHHERQRRDDQKRCVQLQMSKRDRGFSSRGNQPQCHQAGAERQFGAFAVAPVAPHHATAPASMFRQTGSQQKRVSFWVGMTVPTFPQALRDLHLVGLVSSWTHGLGPGEDYRTPPVR